MDDFLAWLARVHSNIILSLFVTKDTQENAEFSELLENIIFRKILSQPIKARNV